MQPGFRMHFGHGGLSSAERGSLHSFLSWKEMLRVPCELVPVLGTVQSRKSPQGAVVAALEARLSDCNVGEKSVPQQGEERC